MTDFVCRFCESFAEDPEIPCECPDAIAYSGRCEAQLQEWVAGRAVHNAVDNECCPDFSCCGSQMVAIEVRLAFKRATDYERLGMLGSFLGGMLKSEGVVIS